MPLTLRIRGLRPFFLCSSSHCFLNYSYIKNFSFQLKDKLNGCYEFQPLNNQTLRV